MNILEFIVLSLGIIIAIFIIAFFVIIEIKASVFPRLGFADSKEDLYAMTFQKFDFDYTITSGIDDNQSEEGLISEAIKQIDTEDNPTMKEVDYYA